MYCSHYGLHRPAFNNTPDPTFYFGTPEHEEALAIVREVGDRAAEGAILDYIGGMYAAQGRYDEALAQYQAARWGIFSLMLIFC